MTAVDDHPPLPAMPPRPKRRLSTLRLLRTAQQNSLAACDEELFEELFVARRLFGRRFYVISDPEGIRRVMQDNADNYPRLTWIRRVFEFVSGSGMLHAEGDLWRRHRRLINPTLDHRALLPDGPMLIELAEEMAHQLAALPPGTPIDLHDAFRPLITISAGHVFAGLDRALDPMIGRMGGYPGRYGVLDLIPTPGWLRPLDRWRKTRIEAARYATVLDRLIAERRDPDYAGRRDLLWRLVNVRDRETGEGLSRDELHDEMLTLGATSITSVRPLPWLWYLLATHPWAERRLHAELDRVLGDGPPAISDLARLTFLRQVLDETMRLYPPLPIMMMRRVMAGDTICGRRVPRGSAVAIIPWVLHRHRKLWRDPDRFDPDRFTPEAIASRSRYAYLPFAAGPHVCVGASMAMLQLIVAVAVLARHFRFRLVPGRPIEPTAWTNLRPKGGLWMTIEPRLAIPSRAALGVRLLRPQSSRMESADSGMTVMPASEKAKMLAGVLYNASDPELVAGRRRAQMLLARYNATSPDDGETRATLLRDLLGAVGEGADIQPRFSCDYGYNIHLGQRAFVNYNCVFLDCAPIEIGDDLQMGPAAQLYTATHPLDRATRAAGLEYARPIRIGDGVWIGGGAIVLPGVAIGDGCVVGAGSVVTRDLPPGSLAVGNPARIIRSLG